MISETKEKDPIFGYKKMLDEQDKLHSWPCPACYGLGKRAWLAEDICPHCKGKCRVNIKSIPD